MFQGNAGQRLTVSSLSTKQKRAIHQFGSYSWMLWVCGLKVDCNLQLLSTVVVRLQTLLCSISRHPPLLSEINFDFSFAQLCRGAPDISTTELVRVSTAPPPESNLGCSDEKTPVCICLTGLGAAYGDLHSLEFLLIFINNESVF